MDDLPIELIVIIFKNLDLSDILFNCKLVCKKWKSIINDHFRPDQLILFDDCFTNYWNYLYKPIDLKCLINCSSMNFIYYPSFKIIFFNLKYLKIDFTINSNDHLSYLSEFKELIHLELLNLIGLKESTFLSLPKLKTFFLNFALDHDSRQLNETKKLTIDAIQLKQLFINNLNELNLIHTYSIEYIQTEFSNDSKLNLSEFKNLNIIKLSRINKLERDRPEDVDILNQNLKNLKQIHFYDCPYCSLSTIHLLNYYLKQRQINNLDIELYYDGIRLLKNRLSHYDYKFGQEYETHQRNYGLIEDYAVNWSIDLDYQKLMNSYQNLIPNDFHLKFVNIQMITFKSNEINENQFASFLRSCSCLSYLVLNEITFTQSFYNQLPSNASSLIDLRIEQFRQIDRALNLKLNYNFILNFKILTSFYCPQLLPVDLILQAINKLKFIKMFHIQTNDTRFFVTKQNKNFYELQCYRIGLIDRNYKSIDLKKISIIYRNLIDGKIGLFDKLKKFLTII